MEVKALMPLVFEDSDGRKIEGGTVRVSGGSCVGCTVVLLLAAVGLGTVLSSLASLIP